MITIAQTEAIGCAIHHIPAREGAIVIEGAPLIASANAGGAGILHENENRQLVSPAGHGLRNGYLVTDALPRMASSRQQA